MDELTGEKMENKIRIQYFDCVKGIAILSIVLGHMVGFNGHMLEDGYLIDFLFTYHVPVFLTISGYFLKVKKGTERKYCLRLLKPYIFATIAITILFIFRKLGKFLLTGERFDLAEIIVYWLVAGLFGAGGRTNFLGFDFPRIGAIWFLLALLWSVLILCFIVKTSSRFSNEKMKLLFIVCVSCVISTIGVLSAKYITWLPLSIQSGTAALPFILIGYLSQGKLQFNKRIEVSSLLIWSLAIFRSFSNQRLSVCNANYPDPFLNIVGGGAATYVLIYMMRELEQKKALKKIRAFLNFLGRNSIVVLTFHLIETKIIPWRFMYRFVQIPIIAFLLIYILKIIWATMWIIIVNKIKILKKVFY